MHDEIKKDTEAALDLVKAHIDGARAVPANAVGRDEGIADLDRRSRQHRSQPSDYQGRRRAALKARSAPAPAKRGPYKPRAARI